MNKLKFEVYREWLPEDFNGNLDEERDRLVHRINEELNYLLTCKEQDTTFCIRLLNRFHSFCYEYTNDERVYIINALLTLIFHKSDLDFHQQGSLFQCLSKLLRSRLKIENLEIPWR